MSGAGIDRPLQFSVLDRLLLGEDDKREVGEDDEDQLRRFVLRDLQWLLNTRHTLQRELSGYPNLQHSVMAYGFVDITSIGKDSAVSRTRLLSQVEETLSLFEPRLSNLRVSVPTVADGLRHQLRFIISGALRADPLPIQFSLDTVIDKLRGAVDVTDQDVVR